MAKMRRQKGTRRPFKLTLQALVQRLSSLSLLKNSLSRGEGMHSWTISCKETISSMGFEGWEAGAKKNKKTSNVNNVFGEQKMERRRLSQRARKPASTPTEAAFEDAKRRNRRDAGGDGMV